jgi:hypothetical protein
MIFAFSHDIAQSGLTVVEGEARHDFGVVARNQPLKKVPSSKFQVSSFKFEVQKGRDRCDLDPS